MPPSPTCSRILWSPCLLPKFQSCGVRRPSPKVKPNWRRRSLRLPDLDHCKGSTQQSRLAASRRVYEYAIDQFLGWCCAPSLGRSPAGLSLSYHLYPAPSVNDLFDFGMDAQQQTRCGESVPAAGLSDAVERDGEQSIECRHGGSEDDRPVCGLETRIATGNEPGWSRSKKAIVRKVFDAVLKGE